jgi:hypothetical protein
MAKKSKPAERTGTNGVAAADAPAESAGAGESIQGYFRKIFKENPRLLKERSNEKLFLRWLEDHPGEKEVPERVKSGLANLKSILRKKRGKRGRPRKEAQATPAAVPAADARPEAAAEPGVLEQLEIQIDDALTMAKNLDRKGLEEVIRQLRTARNLVVWKGGKP